MNKTQIEYITFFFFFNNFKIKKLIWFLHFFKKKFDKFLFISGVEYRWRTADIGQNSSFICEIPLTQIYKIVEENRDFGRWFFFFICGIWRLHVEIQYASKLNGLEYVKLRTVHTVSPYFFWHYYHPCHSLSQRSVLSSFNYHVCMLHPTFEVNNTIKKL